MEKRFKFLFSYLLLSVIFVSCDTRQPSITTVANSENQWPMAGGPDGSWRLTTPIKVPTKWSVRTGENIKWRKTLPEGGQSGIAVWGDRIFLTINPPTDTPKYEHILKSFQAAKKNYSILLNKETSTLIKSNDRQYQMFKESLRAPKKTWDAVLLNNKQYQLASEHDRSSIEEKMLRKNKFGKSYLKALNKLNNYVCSKSVDLQEAKRLFDKLTKEKKGGASSKDIQLLCLDANSGNILWVREIEGTIASQYNYGFSDATTPCPITDGTYVWAINASGGMACFKMDGTLIWARKWIPTTGGKPFNKQFDSILFGDLILNTEPPAAGDITRNREWNYLHAFDKNTGERLWVTQQALTHYNTPVLGQTKEGKPAVLIGRGGPHGVPERPVGLSLISLEEQSTGRSLWDWTPKEENSISGWGALSTQHWDMQKASWFYKSDVHLTIDTKTGKLLAKKNVSTVDQYRFDRVKQQYILTEDVSLKKLENQRHCNISTGDDVFFMVRYAPYILKHNVLTGKNELLEVPQEIDENGVYIWGQDQKNDGLNSKGQLHAFDTRVKGGGFQKCFLGSPTMVNDYIYFTNAVGIVYVIDANAKKMDASALIAVNDLGEKGETWTVNSLSFANGHIYHRTMKEVICIGK